MTGRHMARDRVGAFLRAWREIYPKRPKVTHGFGNLDLLIADLEALAQPRVVVRTIAHLKALPIGTVIMTSANRAAQVEGYEDADENGELIVVKKLLYVGTDLDDYLMPPPLDRLTDDTLRRMLPAVVIHPLD